MDPAERRLRLKKTGWAFHVPGSLLLIGGFAASSLPVLLAGACLLTAGFYCFAKVGRLRR
jgi:hypothetical protein